MKRTILGLAVWSLAVCLPGWGQPVLPTADAIHVTSSVSLIHLGIYDSMEENEDARLAATQIMTLLTKDDRQAGQQALETLRQLTPTESFGTEFTALNWFTRYYLANAAERAQMTPDAYTRHYAAFFAADTFAVLKEYLNARYRFNPQETADLQTAAERLGLLEDLLLFNNPDRNAWEHSDAVLDMLKVKAGDHVVDVAAAPGYFTFKFAARVGPTGRVHASDPRQKHLDYLTEAIRAAGLANVDTVAASLNDIKVEDAADLVFMSSYYTIVYCTDMEMVKDQFMASIRKVLKPDGVLAILNDQYVEKADTPYRGSFVTKQLVVSQLKHYGFELSGDQQANPQRYLLTFKKVDVPPVSGTLADRVKAVGDDQDTIQIASKASLLHLGSLDSFDITEGGKRAARDLLSYLVTKEIGTVRDALDVYKRIIPDENFGGEYTALEWFCEYFLATPAQQQAMLKERLTASYFEFFAADEFAVLKEYLQRKYHLEGLKDADPTKGQDRERLLEDFILFNNPKRESWERTSKILQVLKLKPGQAIADVGCGPGYYSFRFADIVGPTGRIYALDTNGQHVQYVSSLVAKYGYGKAVVPIISQYDDICVKEPIDMAFLCSLYHIIYACSSEKVKDAFVKSIRDVLKPDGSLVIIDNALVEDQQLPYHGPYIAKELIITQMKHYGFRLVESHQFIPQRYVLIFKLDSAEARRGG
jgi:predicted methyltransferase